MMPMVLVLTALRKIVNCKTSWTSLTAAMVRSVLIVDFASVVHITSFSGCGDGTVVVGEKDGEFAL